MSHAGMPHVPPETYFKIPEIYSRAQWEARKPKSQEATELPVIYLVFKVTDTDRCHTKDECMKIIREIQAKDMDEDGLPDIQYNFLIGEDGSLYEGRGWHVAPEPFPMNKQDYFSKANIRSVLIGLIGDSEEKRPSQRQEMSALHLVGIGAEQNYIHDNAQYMEYQEVSWQKDPYEDL